MGRKVSVIMLSDEDRSYLETQLRHVIQAQIVMRARILLLDADGLSIDTIADKVDMNRKSIMLYINADPVVNHWKYKLDEIDSDERIQVETLPLKKSS